MNPNNSSNFCRGLPMELINELFCLLPLENSFGLLAKMSNGLLARNVQKMIKGINAAMKNNKWNKKDCGPKLKISADGLIVKKQLAPTNVWNSVGADLPIPISFYFEVQILNHSFWHRNIFIGFCPLQFALEGKRLGYEKNSIGIGSKGGIWIEGACNKIGNDGELFSTGDIVGIGIIRRPNLKMECFAHIE